MSCECLCPNNPVQYEVVSLIRNSRVVFVHDPTDGLLERVPCGKQALEPSHIFYTPCSGIWQTVWIENVPLNHVAQLDVAADMYGVGKARR